MSEERMQEAEQKWIRVVMLQPGKMARVEEIDFYPDMPGKPRRCDYGTFYDFAPPQNPF